MSRPISAAYLERKLRAITGLQGDNPLPDLETLRGLLTVENDRPEWAFAANEFLGWYGEQAPAAAAETSYITLENPALSGVIAIIERIQNRPDNTGANTNPWTVTVERAPLVTPLGQLTTFPVQPRDLRLPFNFSALIVRTGNDAAPLTGAGPTIANGIAMPGTGVNPRPLTFPIILPPGTRIWLLATIVNQVIGAFFVVRERPLEGTLEIK